MLFFVITFVSFLNAFIPAIVKFILQFVCGESEQESHMCRQIGDLRAELASISMVDEFAKYAKIQRKINKLHEELSNQTNTRMTSFMKLKYGITVGAHVVTGIIVMYILFWYRHEPLLTLPDKWLTPIGWVLAWPTSIPGAVSIPVWLITTSTVSRMLASNLP